MKEVYLTIHGHFYQPPRENPWLESVELQDSASPFHDWNERINNECYNGLRLINEGNLLHLRQVCTIQGDSADPPIRSGP